MGKTKIKVEKYRYATGSDLLDTVVGGSLGLGYPGGKIINIVGDKSSGKTFMACEIIAAAKFQYKDKLEWAYDDCESGFTFDTKAMYGVEIMPPDSNDRVRSETVEELYGNVREFYDNLSSDKLGIYVVDSLDGLSSKELSERGDERYNAHKKGKDFDKGSYQMGKAKFLSQEFFPKIAELVAENNGLLIVISQTREAIGSMFKTQNRSGGKAMDFYAHTVLWLSTLHKIKKKGRAVGVVVKAHAKKSKTPRPYRECIFTLRFDYGLDNIESNLDFLFNLRGDSGALLKVAESIVWNGKSDTLENLKSWMTEINKLEYYRKNVQKTIKKSDLLKWIGEQDDLKEGFSETFGSPMAKAELVQFIEGHRLEDELTRRTLEKWEKIETEIKSQRKPKYGKK